MTFALTSGQVCLAEWTEPLAVDHVVNLLVDLRETRQALRAPPLLVLAIRPIVFAGDGPFEIIPTALPALLDSCSGLFLVLEALSRARAVHALFGDKGCRYGQPTPQIFASVDDALVAAQKIAPHDALELQRQNLRRQFRT